MSTPIRGPRWVGCSQHRLEEGLALCQALGGFWLGQGLLHEGEGWLGRLLADPQLLPARARAEGLLTWGRLAEYAGALDRAQDLFQAGRAVSAVHHDDIRTARALCGLGDLALHHGNYADARQHFEAALGLARGGDGVRETAQALVGLGRTASLAGDTRESVGQLEAALAAQRTLADRWGVAYVLNSLAVLALQTGDLDRAQSLLEECHVLWRQSGTLMGERAAVMNLALVALRRGENTRSAQLVCTSLEISSDMHDIESATTIRCLELAATILGSENSMPAAIALIAAASRHREVLDAPRPAVEQPDVERILNQARAAIGSKSFEAAWNRGRDIPMAAAVEWAAADLTAVIEKR